MPTFKYYNIELLPLDRKTVPTAGTQGYRHLLNSLSSLVHHHLERQALPRIAAPLRNEMLLAPFHVTVGESYAWGKFLRFSQAESIKDIYTGTVEYDLAPTQTSHRDEFLFVFDYQTHILAVQDKQRLPTRRPLEAALRYIFELPHEDFFHQYTLRCHEITSCADLEHVFDVAEGFTRAHIEVSFSNSDEFDDALTDTIERELRDRNIHDVEHTEKSAKDSMISRFSSFA